MDIEPPSFSLGIDVDDDDPGSRRREQSRDCAAPDPPSFSLGLESDDDEEEPQLPIGGRREEQARRCGVPDAPSFSLGIDLDDDEQPQLPSGGRPEEQARRCVVPDAPKFALGGKQAQPQVAPRASYSTVTEEEDDDFAFDGGKPPSPPPETNRLKRLRKGPAQTHPAPAPQLRRYEAPDPPSFSLGIDDDDFLPGGQHHEQPRLQAAPSSAHSLCVEEDDDDFVVEGDRRPKRLQSQTLDPGPLPPLGHKRPQRGAELPHLAPRPKLPKLSMAETTPEMTGKGALEDESLEDEIEDFTDDERPGRDVPPSVGSCSSNSKSSLSALLSRSATKANISKFKQHSVPSTSIALEESCTKKLLPKITISPMRKIHLLDSDTDEDDDWDKNKANKPVSPLKNIQESMSSYIHKHPTMQQNSKLQGSTLVRKTTLDDNLATPALDEFCSEYFNTIKESEQSQQRISSNTCHSSVPPQPKCIGEMDGHQSSSSRAVLDVNPTDNSPPAIHYFSHHDPMVRDLVRERLQHFFPIGTESTRGNEQSRAGNLSHRQFSSGAAANNGWVTPSGRVPVPTDVGRRRVHARGTQSASGHWYTGEDGRKVYVSKNGQELTGQIAYRQYKRESGRGFKKGAAKRGSSGSKRGAAKPKKEPSSTKQGTSRARRKG